MKDKIEFFCNKNEDVISLWQEAFGDSREDIEYFLNNCKNKTAVGFFEDEKLVSMLFLVDCNVDNTPSKYIYAACTLNSYKKQGIMSKLLSFTQSNFKSIVLIPADESLVGFYKKRGFSKAAGLENLIFDETESIKEYLLEGCELEKPFLLWFKKEGEN